MKFTEIRKVSLAKFNKGTHKNKRCNKRMSFVYVHLLYTVTAESIKRKRHHFDAGTFVKIRHKFNKRKRQER